MVQKLLLLLLASVISSSSLFAQQKLGVIDSITKLYKAARQPEQKVNEAGKLSLLYVSIDPAKSDSFSALAIEHGELSRDRKLMVKSYLYNAERYATMAGKKEYIPKAIEFYNKAYTLARTNKLEEEMVSSLLGLAGIHRSIPDADKAMNYTAQAFAVLSDRGLDSLEARCYMSFGNNYLLKKEKLLALKNYFNALKLSEQVKDAQLMRDSYLMLSRFYVSVENYDKAIDYVVKATAMLEKIADKTAGYLKVNDLNYIGGLFVMKKQYHLARKNYDEAIAVADQLKYDPLKISSYMSIFNMYLLSNQPSEALKYFNSKPELKSFMLNSGYASVIDHAYGYIYTDMGRLDSAEYYYKKALPFFSQQLNNANKIHFFDHYAKYQFKAKNYDHAIKLLEEANATAKQMNDLEWQQKMSRLLDSAYQLKGDYRTALVFSNQAQQLKDTLEQLGKEEDILQLQLADEDERLARQALLQEEAKKRRHQYQYLAITIGIAVLFVLLVMMGTFKVSAGTIRIVGFFTFLMLFEFVFLISKKKFYEFTEGEPWKDLAFMILLAAMLLPLHHYIEHKVIHYLTSRQLIKIDTSKYLITRWFGKKDKLKQPDNLLQ